MMCFKRKEGGLTSNERIIQVWWYI